ncbi:uncharacterized protein [Elaeis guineensis]|uniref:Uncharacterized protein LOC105058137 isoform X1 n=1 Tax=Elaeis guineensis var. tenera TaxID=51953 RepID=A0A6I9S939_ELAGV|nr:uncharacterized protein LOC105058137 isoform X1 [Elaeis guineensis]
MSGNSPDFVKWREEFISQERGSRVVHYYLEDSKGDSHLAVVGTERSLRHMLYVVSEQFCQAYGPDKSGVSCLKWRSRREVVDWLTSFLPAKTCTPSNSKSAKYEVPQSLIADVEVNGFNETGGYLFKHTDKGHNSDIMWSGVSWTCGKQLRHYQAFCRNGTTIATHSFVLVMSEVVNRYLAYLEDMYEDKKGQKKVKVRWFHQNQEFACTIPPPTPHPSEVFITPYSQVISAECVDDIATVLTPDHYEKCVASLPCASTAGIRLCFRQYSKNKFKLFDLTTLRGYFDQAVLARVDISTMFGKEEEESGHGRITKRAGPKRIRFIKGHQKLSADHLAAKMSACRPAYENLRYELPGRRPLSVKFVGPRNWPTPPFKVGEKIELLCQDSGIRGCWFKCTVLQLSHRRLKVRYDDLQNVDGCGNVEEWIPAFRPAAPDKLGMRCSGRLTIRPCPLCDCLLNTVAFLNGTPVDAWWNDGWWEGVVVGTDSCEDDRLQVYFPGEDVFLICQRKNLRISKDWVGNQWVNIQAKPDILSAISSVSRGAKLTACSIFTKGAESGGSAMSDQELLGTQANSNEEDKQAEASLSDRTDLDTKQVNSRKRPRDEGAEEVSEEKVGIGGDES